MLSTLTMLTVQGRIRLLRGEDLPPKVHGRKTSCLLYFERAIHKGRSCTRSSAGRLAEIFLGTQVVTRVGWAGGGA